MFSARFGVCCCTSYQKFRKVSFYFMARLTCCGNISALMCFAGQPYPIFGCYCVPMFTGVYVSCSKFSRVLLFVLGDRSRKLISIVDLREIQCHLAIVPYDEPSFSMHLKFCKNNTRVVVKRTFHLDSSYAAAMSQGGGPRMLQNVQAPNAPGTLRGFEQCTAQARTRVSTAQNR